MENFEATTARDIYNARIATAVASQNYADRDVSSVRNRVGSEGSASETGLSST